MNGPGLKTLLMLASVTQVRMGNTNSDKNSTSNAGTSKTGLMSLTHILTYTKYNKSWSII